jgi:hypothetical protein
MEHNPLNTAPLSADPAAEPRRPYIAPTITNLSQITPGGKPAPSSAETSALLGPS